MNRRFRLTESSRIQRVRKIGKSYVHPLLILLAVPADQPETRFAIIAGQRIGHAVIRNRIKRQIRACLRLLVPGLSPGWDVVIITRPPIVSAQFADIQTAIHDICLRAGLVNT